LQVDNHEYNNIQPNETLPQDIKYETDLAEEADGMDDNMSEELNSDNGNGNDIADDKKETTHKKGILKYYLEKSGLMRFPMAKVKKIMKLNPNIGVCQKNSYIVIGKLAELFLQELSRNAASVAKINKRKTMNI
jgi:hypothetical protein